MEKTTLKFSRSRHVEPSREIAILSLDLHTHTIGEPALVNYYTNPEHTEIDTIFSIGVKNGAGRDCYRVVTLGQYDLLWEVVDSLPDVSSLVHSQLYAYVDENGDWFYVYEEGGERVIEPFDSTPRIFLCIHDNTLWFSGEDRKLRCITNILTKTEIDALLADMRQYVFDLVQEYAGDAALALEKVTELEGQVSEMQGEVNQLSEDFATLEESIDGRFTTIETNVSGLTQDLGSILEIDSQGKRIGTFDTIEVSDSLTIGGSEVVTEADLNSAIETLDTDLQGQIDDLNTRVTSAEGDIDTLENDLDAIRTKNQDGTVSLHAKNIALTSTSTIGNSNIATISDVDQSRQIIEGEISNVQNILQGNIDTVATNLGTLETTLGGEISDLETRVTAAEGDIDNLELWQENVDPTIKKIDNKTFPLVATLNGGLTGEYDGQLHAVALSWNFKIDGETVTPATLTLKKGDTTLSTDPSASGYPDQVSLKGTTTYTLTGTYADTLQTKTSAVASTNVTLYLPKYVGHSEKSGSLVQADITGLTKQAINGNTAGTYTTTSNSDYVWLCFPAEFRLVAKMTSGGFDFAYETPVTVSITINGTDYSYRCYRSTNRLTGNWTITVTQS